MFDILQKTHKRLTAVFGLLLVASVTAGAVVRLPNVLSDNMVLQQKADVALWGWASPDVKVVIRPSWGSEKYVVCSDADGKWQCRVRTPQAGGPYSIKISDGKATELKNILIGEVWLCVGQSNMQMPVKGFVSQPVEDAIDEIASADPAIPIRICQIKKTCSRIPLEDQESRWVECTSENVADCSAVSWFFAKKMQACLKVPVGILVVRWNGTPLQAWIPRDIIEKDFAGVYDEDLEFIDGGGEFTYRQSHTLASFLYNGQIAPIIPFTFKGIIMYQGCSNRTQPALYKELQQKFVSMLRERFVNPDAPYYFTQIAPYSYDDPSAFLSGYFREAQAACVDLIPNSAIVSTLDVGSSATVHPPFKKTVADRLAYLALSRDYGFKGFTAKAPVYSNCEFKNGEAHVFVESFDNLGVGPMGELSGFEISGSDKVFKPAEATVVNGKEIKVWSKDVHEPVAVRYNFRNWATATVFNSFGIPLLPFRTDNWDEIAK